MPRFPGVSTPSGRANIRRQEFEADLDLRRQVAGLGALTELGRLGQSAGETAAGAVLGRGDLTEEEELLLAQAESVMIAHGRGEIDDAQFQKVASTNKFLRNMAGGSAAAGAPGAGVPGAGPSAEAITQATANAQAGLPSATGRSIISDDLAKALPPAPGEDNVVDAIVRLGRDGLGNVLGELTREENFGRGGRFEQLADSILRGIGFGGGQTTPSGDKPRSPAKKENLDIPFDQGPPPSNFGPQQSFDQIMEGLGVPRPDPILGPETIPAEGPTSPFLVPPARESTPLPDPAVSRALENFVGELLGGAGLSPEERQAALESAQSESVRGLGRQAAEGIGGFANQFVEDAKTIGRGVKEGSTALGKFLSDLNQGAFSAGPGKALSDSVVSRSGAAERAFGLDREADAERAQFAEIIRNQGIAEGQAAGRNPLGIAGPDQNPLEDPIVMALVRALTAGPSGLPGGFPALSR